MHAFQMYLRDSHLALLSKVMNKLGWIFVQLNYFIWFHYAYNLIKGGEICFVLKYCILFTIFINYVPTPNGIYICITSDYKEKPSFDMGYKRKYKKYLPPSLSNCTSPLVTLAKIMKFYKHSAQLTPYFGNRSPKTLANKFGKRINIITLNQLDKDGSCWYLWNCNGWKYLLWLLWKNDV